MMYADFEILQSDDTVLIKLSRLAEQFCRITPPDNSQFCRITPPDNSQFWWKGISVSLTGKYHISRVL